MKTVLLLACCIRLASASAQELNAQLPLVRKLDAMSVPREDFTARVTIRKTKAGTQTAEESRFRQYSRRRTEPGGRVVLDTLVICDEPKKDAGKMVLFADDTCWAYDPHAKRATRISSQQVAAHALVTASMNWRFVDDFDHRFYGRETITIAGKSHDCTVLDFTPKPTVKNRSSLVRCWLDSAGRPWKAEHYTASRKVFRSVFFTKYETVLGAERAVGLNIANRGEIEEISMTNVKAATSPDSFFDPEQLPKLVVPSQ